MDFYRRAFAETSCLLPRFKRVNYMCAVRWVPCSLAFCKSWMTKMTRCRKLRAADLEAVTGFAPLSLDLTRNMCGRMTCGQTRPHTPETRERNEESRRATRQRGRTVGNAEALRHPHTHPRAASAPASASASAAARATHPRALHRPTAPARTQASVLRHEPACRRAPESGRPLLVSHSSPCSRPPCDCPAASPRGVHSAGDVRRVGDAGHRQYVRLSRVLACQTCLRDRFSTASQLQLRVGSSARGPCRRRRLLPSVSDARRSAQVPRPKRMTRGRHRLGSCGRAKRSHRRPPRRRPQRNRRLAASPPRRLDTSPISMHGA